MALATLGRSLPLVRMATLAGLVRPILAERCDFAALFGLMAVRAGHGEVRPAMDKPACPRLQDARAVPHDRPG